MHAMIHDLVSQWDFSIGDDDSAFGELAGIPTALTILGTNPLALMLTCKIATPDGDNFRIPENIASLVAKDAASVSLENGYAWFSLYNLGGKSADDVRGLFEQFAAALKEQDVAIGPGCSVCGSAEGAELCFSNGKCNRICEPCITARLEERQQQQEQYRPSTFHSYALPWAVGLAGVGWMVFWVLIDLLLDFLNTNTIAIPHVVTVIVLIAVGFVLGAPVGLVLKKSGMGRRSPALSSIVAVSLAVLIGEAFYISAYIYRHFGFLDLAAGFQSLVLFVSGYDGSWIFAKFLVAIAIGLGCFAACDEEQPAAGLPI